MASELSWRHSSTGSTVYGTIRSAARTYWNGSSLETLTVANWGNYDIALAESPASSYFYVGDWPAALTTAGWYWVDVYEQAGGSPAIGDSLIGTLYGYWNGTKFEPAGGDVGQWKGATAPAMTGDAYAVANGRLPAALTANGNIKASLTEILTAAVTGTAAQISAAFTKFFDKATPTGTINSLPDVVAGQASGLALVGSAMTLATDALSAGSISTAALDKLCKIMGVTSSVNAAGTEIKYYNTSGALVATLTKSGTDPVIWTAAFA